jgi:hypothetical protein
MGRPLSEPEGSVVASMGRTLGAPKSRVPVERMGGGRQAACGPVHGVVADRKLPDPITVSVICPTINRQHWHENLYKVFKSQDYAHKDLWILDDTYSGRSPFFDRLADAQVHYVHQTGHMSTGSKRNRLIQMSQGSVLAHFDDDDWYAPNYLSSMVGRLVCEDADFVKLAAWNEHRAKDGSRWQARPRTHADVWGYGFTYVFRRYVATRTSCPDWTRNEDYAFACGVEAAGMRAHLVQDGAHLVEHLLHGQNTSKKG